MIFWSAYNSTQLPTCFIYDMHAIYVMHTPLHISSIFNISFIFMLIINSFLIHYLHGIHVASNSCPIYHLVPGYNIIFRLQPLSHFSQLCSRAEATHIAVPYIIFLQLLWRELRAKSFPDTIRGKDPQSTSHSQCPSGRVATLPVIFIPVFKCN